MSQLDIVLNLIDNVTSARPHVLVGIGGHGGSGKSTLALAISHARTDTQIIGTDSFWNGTQFELPRLRTDVVDALLRGEHATYASWDWAGSTPGPRRTVAPSGVVVIEGVCALHEMFRHDLDVRIWISAPADVRLERGVARDGEGSRARWTDVWIPSEDAYVARDNPVACTHVVIDGTQPY